MRVNKWLVILLALSLCAPSLSEQLSGKVEIKTKPPSRATRGKKGHNSRKLQKDFGYKRSFLLAESKHGGGPPEGAVFDEKSYVVVYVTQQHDGAKLQAQPKKIHIDQTDRQFKPHVTAAVVGSEVNFLNSDPFFHHIFSTTGEKFEIDRFLRGNKSIVLRKVGSHELFCNIHPRMNAYILVVPNNHFSQLDEQGNFRITNLPPGKYLVKAWHPRLPPQTQVVNLVKGKAAQVNLSL